MRYAAPPDKTGAIAAMLGAGLEKKLETCLRRLKEIVEEGEPGLLAGGTVEEEQTIGSGLPQPQPPP
jgi:hypothetical protein